MSDQHASTTQPETKYRRGTHATAPRAPDTTAPSQPSCRRRAARRHRGAGARRSPGELETHFRDPGLPAHVYRHSDIDPKAAKRREREVATLFGLSTLGTLLFIVAFFAVKPTDATGAELVERVGLSTKLLGLGLGLALFCIGAGAIHWAKTLMPDDEIVTERKPMRSSDEDRDAAVEALKEGAAGAGLGRRKLIRNSLLGALAPLGLLAIIPLRDLGPLPGDSLEHTAWKAGKRLDLRPGRSPDQGRGRRDRRRRPRAARGHREDGAPRSTRRPRPPRSSCASRPRT